MGKPTKSVPFPLVNPHAAAVDVGSRSNWACAGPGKGHIKEFGVFTEDHHGLAKWLRSHHVTTVAMESTGIYWKPLFLILQSYGFEAVLVNAAHVKNVRGKKTDMADCHWIWQLHRAGLLKGSFQPDGFTGELRTYNRQRQSLIEGAARCISRMQKALVLMNLQLPVVLTDITGKSGTAIIQAILGGERDGRKLAALADPRVKASKGDIARALTGQWQGQYLFTLQQAWELYRFQWQQIRQCDHKIDELLRTKTQQTGQRELVYSPTKKQRQKNTTTVAIDELAYQLTDGVDLMQVPGLSYTLLMTIAAETGLDLATSFPSAKHFTSWLGLAPNKKITGGKVISNKTQKKKNRLAQAFRKAANAVGRQKNNPLSDFFKRVAYKKSRPVAITATARKIAVIVYNMLTKKQGFKPMTEQDCHLEMRQKRVKYIQRTIRQLGITPDELKLGLA